MNCSVYYVKQLGVWRESSCVMFFYKDSNCGTVETLIYNLRLFTTSQLVSRNVLGVVSLTLRELSMIFS